MASTKIALEARAFPARLDRGRQIEKQAIGDERPTGRGLCFESRDARGERALDRCRDLSAHREIASTRSRALIVRRGGLLGNPFLEAHALFAGSKPSSNIPLQIRDAFVSVCG